MSPYAIGTLDFVALFSPRIHTVSPFSFHVFDVTCEMSAYSFIAAFPFFSEENLQYYRLH